jgi:hypothetical protein
VIDIHVSLCYSAIIQKIKGLNMNLNNTNDFSNIAVGELVVVTQNEMVAVVKVIKVNPKSFNTERWSFNRIGKSLGDNKWHTAHVYRGEENIAEARAEIKKIRDLRTLRDFDLCQLNKENQDKVLAIIQDHYAAIRKDETDKELNDGLRKWVEDYNNPITSQQNKSIIKDEIEKVIVQKGLDREQVYGNQK